MSIYIPNQLRALVKRNANNCCEYCLIHEDDSFLSFHIDHIISLKHGGQTDLNNLAFACAICNQEKGSDLGTYLKNNEHLIRFYNPKKDSWSDHFFIRGHKILSKTAIGEATIKIFKFNTEHRLLERKVLSDVKRYPTIEALSIINSDQR